MYSTTKVIYGCLFYFTETHSLVVHYSLRETILWCLVLLRKEAN